MSQTQADLAAFGPQVASAREAAAATAAWAKPDSARVMAVLNSFGPAAGPHLAAGLVRHLEKQHDAGARLAGEYRNTAAGLSEAKVKFAATEDRNTAALGGREVGSSTSRMTPVASTTVADPPPKPTTVCEKHPPTQPIRPGPVLGGRQSYEFGAYSRCQADFVAGKARELGAQSFHPRFGVPYQKDDGWYVLAPWSAW